MLGVIVILDNLRSAHNVGSIIRTCDALGIGQVYFCGITPPHDDKKVLKTSLGAEKNVSAAYAKNTFDLVTELSRKGYQIIGLEIDQQAVDLSGIDASPKAALIVGNEVSGLPQEILELCDVVVQIPMQGVKESLNVSVAFGIAAYELVQRK